MNNVKIVDVSSVLYSGLTGKIGEFKYRGIPTGGLYQLGMVIAQSLKFGQFLILVWDSRTNRRELLPSYKASRSRRPEIEFWKNVSWKYLNKVVTNSFKVEGFEADDLAAELLDRYTEDLSYTMITSDYDWAYNIKNSKYTLRPVNTNLPEVTMDNFKNILDKENIGLVFNTLCFYKCLFGDTSDNISGFCFTKYPLTTLYKLFLNYTLENKLNPRIRETAYDFLETYKVIFTNKEYENLKIRIDIIYPRKQIDFNNSPLELKPAKFNFVDFEVFCNLIGSKKLLRAVDGSFVEDMGDVQENLRLEWESIKNSYENQTHIFTEENTLTVPSKGGFILK